MKLLSILALSGFAFVAAAPAEAADFSPALQQVIVGAKKEGKLVWYLDSAAAAAL